MTSLIYIADPMCSWCYGFGPDLSALLDGLPGMPLDIVVGGLRTNTLEAMDATLKENLTEHWKKVEKVSNLPFSYDILDRADFIYDTEPACRAVVAARQLAPAATLRVFYAIQHAFYAEGKDVTRADILAEVAAAALTEAGMVIDAQTFLAEWAAEKTIEATQTDFFQTQTWKVIGFPTLVLERNGKLDLVTSGYTQMPKLIENLQELVDRDETNTQQEVTQDSEN